jgi:hypothetical protein
MPNPSSAEAALIREAASDILTGQSASSVIRRS